MDSTEKEQLELQLFGSLSALNEAEEHMRASDALLNQQPSIDSNVAIPRTAANARPPLPLKFNRQSSNTAPQEDNEGLVEDFVQRKRKHSAPAQPLGSRSCE
ncbi:hypothetical protein Ndes2526B_g02018 [Nannochloris sp. 'desiccata']|nr:hypothetical protein KSW81_004139 [Chlorella desiccata (nom. nud.)]KAH7623575.1 hypothetical protein NADE_002762 [Chlorella desiccata (nom. nud.)]